MKPSLKLRNNIALIRTARILISRRRRRPDGVGESLWRLQHRKFQLSPGQLRRTDGYFQGRIRRGAGPGGHRHRRRYARPLFTLWRLPAGYGRISYPQGHHGQPERGMVRRHLGPAPALCLFGH